MRADVTLHGIETDDHVLQPSQSSPVISSSSQAACRETSHGIICTLCCNRLYIQANTDIKTDRDYSHKSLNHQKAGWKR